MRATNFAALCFLACTVIAAPRAAAQISPDDVAQTGPRSEEVEQALFWSRVNSEIVYLKPSATFSPDGDVRIEVPDPPKEVEEVRDEMRLSTGIVFGVVLVVIVALILRFGNNIQVSFGSSRERGRGGAGDDDERLLPGLDGAPRDAQLEYFAAMADRREALILMTGHALERAASMNGVTLARAQTARDVLRVLPGGWPHMNAISQLVRQAEVVHFGGRDLAEDTWQACLDLARPLFAGRAA